MGVVLLGLDVDRLVVVLGIDDDGEVEALGIRSRKARVAVGAPLHRRANSIAVAEVEVVAHPDLVAVVEHRRPREGEEQRVHQLHAAAVVAEQRRQPAANAQVDARLRIVGVDAVHVVALLVGHHLERELVVVAQEEPPLAGLRDGRGLLQDVDDRVAILHVERHEEPRHHREVEGHVALVALAEVRHGVLGPLVRLGQQQPVAVLAVHVAAQILEEGVGLGEVLAVGAFALVEVGNRIEPQAVHAEAEPEVEEAEDGLAHVGRVEVQVRLVGVEAMPVVGLGHADPRSSCCARSP